MEKIIISTDSTSDLAPQTFEERSIRVLDLSVILGSDMYKASEVNPQMIFDFVNQTGTLPKTSATSEMEYGEYFEELLKETETVIHFNISSQCSVTHNNAKKAAAAFNGKVKVIDSYHLSTGQGLLVLLACDLRDEGKSAEEIVETIENTKNNIQTSFVVDTMEYLKKGGRCSSVAAIAANVLKIHPSIFMKDGKLGVRKKYMGSLKRCISSYVDDLAEEYPDYVDTRVFITHSCCTDEIVEHIKQKVQEKFAFNEICVTVAGPVITSHCGQGTLGVLFIKK